MFAVPAFGGGFASQHTRFALGPAEAKMIVENMRQRVSATWYDIVRAEGVSEEKDSEAIRGAFVYEGFDS